MNLEELLPLATHRFLFLFIRIGAITMLMPVVGEAYVPARARLSLALAIAFLLTPVLGPYIPDMPAAPLEFGRMLAGELVIGLFIGLSAQITISALQTAGVTIAYQAGLANALVFNPVSAQQSSIFGAFLVSFGVTLLVVSDLHHLLFIAMRDSYIHMPPGDYGLTADFGSFIAQLVNDSFKVGLRIAAPFIIVSLIFYLGVGLLARLMPQVQIFFIAIPVQVLLGFAVALTALSMIGLAFIETFEQKIGAFTIR